MFLRALYSPPRHPFILSFIAAVCVLCLPPQLRADDGDGTHPVLGWTEYEVRVLLPTADAKLLQGVEWDSIPVPVAGLPAPDYTTVPEDILPAAYREIAVRQFDWALIESRDGTSSLLRIRFHRPPLRRTPFALQFTDGRRVDMTTRPDHSLQCGGPIAFSADLSSLYVSLANTSSNPLTISRLRLGGEVVAENLADKPGYTIAPHQTRVIRVRLPSGRLALGDRSVMTVETTGGATLISPFAVVTGFPIGREHDAPPENFGLDMAAPATYGSGAKPELTDDRQGMPILDCPTHQLARDDRSAAMRLFQLDAAYRSALPAHPLVLHICRTRYETGMDVFAARADVVRFNPCPASGYSATVSKYAALAVSRAEANPVHAVVATREGQEDMPPTDLRKVVFDSVARGVRGIYYRHYYWNTPEKSAINSELMSINAELAAMRDWLATAIPWRGATLDQYADSTEARLLLSPDHGLVLIILNHNAERTGKTVTVTLPDVPGLKATDTVRLVTADGLVDLNTTAHGATSFSLPLPDAAAAYIIESDLNFPEVP